MIILYSVGSLAANRLSFSHLEEAKSYVGRALAARNQGVLQLTRVHAGN